MAEEPAQKKARMVALSKPSIVSGIVSASRSASFKDSEHPLIIQCTPTNLPNFFSSGDSSFDTITLREEFPCQEWLQKSCPEQGVCDDIYKELKAQGISFPAESEGQNSSCKEKQLSTIFTQHAADHFNERNLNIKEKEQGLLTKLSSKPDLCVVRGRDLIVGEIKQKPSYSTGNAKRQTPVYIYALLYYYRVVLGIPVVRAFGFWVCGPNCLDLKNQGVYALGIVEVRAPKMLGESFRGSEYSEEYNIDSSDGLKLLIHFLKNGLGPQFLKDGSNQPTTLDKATPLNRKQRGPFRFALPAKLWEEKRDDGIDIVKGGTSSMVFKVPQEKLCNFLQENIRCPEKFLDKYVKPWVQRQQAQGKELYVKVRTKDTSVHFEKGFGEVWRSVKEEKDRIDTTGSGSPEDGKKWQALNEFLETYVVKPLDRYSFCLCIMACRGRAFQFEGANGPSIPVEKLADALEQVKTNVIGLSEFVTHGDILAHNFVCEGNSLHLVDYDEGSLIGDDEEKGLPRRSVAYDGEFAWLQATMYPNALRNFGMLYTKVQLFAFMFIVLYTLAPTVSLHVAGPLPIEKLGNLLKANDESEENGWTNDPDVGEKAIPEQVLKLIESLDNFLPGKAIAPMKLV